MSRIPIRARLAGAFALAMLLVLVAAAGFVFVRLKADLNESIDNGLRSRADDVAALAVRAAARAGGTDRLLGGANGPVLRQDETLIEADESFVQVLSDDGGLAGTRGGAGTEALTPPETARVLREGPLEIERVVNGIEGTARMLARPVKTLDGTLVVVAGTSLEDRDETIATVLASFAIGGPIAILLASGIGYLLAAAGLAPVEAMRRRAEDVSLERPGERLPLPEARDEVHRLGLTLNDMLARLEGSFERERRFVADAGHEMRTPLAVLKTELETALRSPAPDAEVRASLAAALEEADHLAALADDLLILTRAGEEGLTIEPDSIGARDLLEGARDRFADRARERRREIVVDAPEALRVRADPLRARQALGNLVDNALRHGEGTITLSARPAPDGVELDVSDEGDGFPSDFAARAFERFTRADTARTRGGSGLGLAIVRAICAAHGGAAEIVDGATVRLILPDA